MKRMKQLGYYVLAAFLLTACQSYKNGHAAGSFPFAVDAVEDLGHMEKSVVIAVLTFHRWPRFLPFPVRIRVHSAGCGRRATWPCFRRSG